MRRPGRAAALVALVAAVGVVSAVAIGWLVGRQTVSRPSGPVSGARTAAVGPARVEVPRAWTPEPVRATGIAGLPATTRVFSLSHGLPAHALVATGAPADPSLIPQPLRSRVVGDLPQPRKTALGGHPAWLYPQLVTRDPAGRMDVTVVPTGAGVVAVACVAPQLGWSEAVDCAGRVGRLAVTRAPVFVPARDLALRLRLPRVIADLNRVRTTERAALAGAHTRLGQASIARRLGAAYAGAARELARVAAGTASPVPAALRDTAAAYDRLARAADLRRPGTYARESAAVGRAERALARTLPR